MRLHHAQQLTQVEAVMVSGMVHELLGGYDADFAVTAYAHQRPLFEGPEPTDVRRTLGF
jgi:hypothetical protein